MINIKYLRCDPFPFLLEAMRQILLNGATLGAVSNQAAILALFTAILLPLGLGAFAYGLKTAKIDGSLIHY